MFSFLYPIFHYTTIPKFQREAKPVPDKIFIDTISCIIFETKLGMHDITV
jgi:hypothetical protein